MLSHTHDYPLNTPMPPLFTPLTIKDITLRNRIGVSPMCQYSAQDGRPNNWHLAHLGARAVGGAGLIIAEATAVTPQGRISPQDTGLWNDQQVADWQPITAFMAEQGAVPAVQLAHAGRKASSARPWASQSGSLSDEDGGWETVGPTAEPFGRSLSRAPRAMSHADMAQLVADFGTAAQRALEAGFQMVEIHAAHGYLLHSFYSPLSNSRTDQYGGSFENRIRLLLEVVGAVRAVWPERLPLAVRLNCSDWHPEGWTIEDSVALAHLLKGGGVDLVDCSSSMPIPNPGIVYDTPPGWQVPFAQAIRRETGLLTAAVGGIAEPAHANEIIGKGQADVALLARAMLRDPHWAHHAALALGMDSPPAAVPAQYVRGFA
jgi:2,4-dienoyl-CoA reductase-like NADH-dependent reductase (Old Yellow Enzyme family)